jgi:hypothetical protein
MTNPYRPPDVETPARAGAGVEGAKTGWHYKSKSSALPAIRTAPDLTRIREAERHALAYVCQTATRSNPNQRAWALANTWLPDLAGGRALLDHDDDELLALVRTAREMRASYDKRFTEILRGEWVPADMRVRGGALHA